VVSTLEFPLLRQSPSHGLGMSMRCLDLQSVLICTLCVRHRRPSREKYALLFWGVDLSTTKHKVSAFNGTDTFKHGALDDIGLSSVILKQRSKF